MVVKSWNPGRMDGVADFYPQIFTFELAYEWRSVSGPGELSWKIQRGGYTQERNTPSGGHRIGPETVRLTAMGGAWEKNQIVLSFPASIPEKNRWNIKNIKKIIP